MTVRHLAFVAACAAALTGISLDAQRQGGAAQPDISRPRRPTYASTGQIEVIKVQGNVYMLAGAGSNITVMVGNDELVVVDTNEEAMSDKVIAAIKSISPLPVRTIINTSADLDHVGGNERIAKSSGTNVNAFLQQGARVFANENAYGRMANPKDGSQPLPSGLWPTDAFAAPLFSLSALGEPVELIHQPNAHTDGDLMVFFRRSDVVAAGDIFVTNTYPVIDARRGGSLKGILDGLNRLIDIAIPEYNSMGGTRIIPGHGRISNEIDLVEFRDHLTIIADRVTQLVLDGKTVDQVRAAGVSLDFDGVYGTTTGPWTTEMFLNAVYSEVKGNTAPWRARLTRNVPIDDLQQVTTAFRPAPRPGVGTGRGSAAARRVSTDPLDGKWSMNVFVSKYEPVGLTPYRKEMTFAVNGEEVTHYTGTWRRQGNASPLTTSTYTAKFDGAEYTIPRTTSKVSWKRVDASTLERTMAGGDGSKETGTWTLSADRRTLTVVTSGVDPTGVTYTSTQVFEKQ
ncbi:MAG: MBL fold metallo-hydrolase [Vicinamibacterales bacterium]